MSKCVCEKSSSADPNRIYSTVCEENLKRDVLSVAIQFVYAWMDMHKSDNMSSIPPDSTVTCANCGKGGEGDDGLKFCAACKLVKYCSRECQSAHRPQHMKECKKRAAELYEEALFEEHPLPECPLCFQPGMHSTLYFQSCCGKVICDGCNYALTMLEINKVEKKALYDTSTSREDLFEKILESHLCPFCRIPAAATDEEERRRTEYRMNKYNDAFAFKQLADCYSYGQLGLQRDVDRAIKLSWYGELGCASAYHNLGVLYDTDFSPSGRGCPLINTHVYTDHSERYAKEAKHYFELAAMGGNVNSRHNLGWIDLKDDKYHRSMKHFMIAAKSGHDDALKKIGDGYKAGLVPKDDYASALRSHQKVQNEMKSVDREAMVAKMKELYGDVR